MHRLTIGQKHIYSYLKAADTEQRVAHTLLFSGNAGFGLFETGLAVAKFILCTAPDEKPCGVCNNCLKIKDLQHPDFHLFFPTAKAKVTSSSMMSQFRTMINEETYIDYTDWLEFMGDPDKSLNINIDIIKEINQAFGYKSFEGGRRVYLIWGAEFLAKEGNKLLKVIEEPPENAYIILLAENRGTILPTILSRCQTFLLKPLSADELLQAMKLDPTDENIKRCSLADGNVKNLKAYFHDGNSDLQEQWLVYLRLGFKGNPTELVTGAHQIAEKGKEYARQYLRYGLKLLRILLKNNSGIPTEIDPSVEKLAQLLSLQDLELIGERLQKDFFYINRNANLKLLFSSQAIWVAELFRKKKKSTRRT